MPIVISLGSQDEPNCWLGIDALIEPFDNPLYCVSNYPAKYDDYIRAFSPNQLRRGISDHTNDFSLFRKFEPERIEWHYKLLDSTGLDAGPFARTPEQLREVL